MFASRLLNTNLILLHRFSSVNEKQETFFIKQQAYPLNLNGFRLFEHKLEKSHERRTPEPQGSKSAGRRQPLIGVLHPYHETSFSGHKSDLIPSAKIAC